LSTAKNAHDGGIIKIKYSSFFDTLVTAGNTDNSIKLWSMKNNNLFNVADFRGHKQRILDFDFIPEKKLVISADKEGHVRVWDPYNKDKQELQDLSVKGISSLIYISKETIVFMGKSNGEIAIHTLTAKVILNVDPRHTFEAHDNGIPCMIWCDAKNLLVTGGQDANIKIWSYRKTTGTCELYHNCKVGRETIRSLVLVQDDYVISTNGTKKLRVWNINDGLQSTMTDGPDNNGGALAYVKEKPYILGVFNNKLGVWIDLKD